MDAAILARVSDDKGGTSASVPEQISAGEAACGELGWDVAGIFADTDISASRFARQRERQEWQRLQRCLDHFGAVVLWSTSRGSRELEDWAGFLNRCREHGVLIHVITDKRTYDVRVGRDWKQLAEDGIDSAYESEKRSADIKRGLHGAMAAGNPIGGHTPHGYIKVRDPGNGKVMRMEISHEHERDIINVFALANAGHSVTATAQRAGVSRQNVRAWLRNPVYAGLRQLPDGSYIKGKWPAIVREDMFWRVQDLLDGHLHAGEKHPGLYRSLLSYLASCGVCGKPITTEPSRDRYRCVRGCVTFRPIDEADLRVEIALATALEEPGVMERFLPDASGNAAAARAEAAQLRQRIDDALHSYLVGRIKIGTLERIEKALWPQQIAAEERARKATVPAALHPLLDGSTKRFGDIWEILQAMPLAGARAILRATCTVEIQRGREVEVMLL